MNLTVISVLFFKLGSQIRPGGRGYFSAELFEMLGWTKQTCFRYFVKSVFKLIWIKLRDEINGSTFKSKQ